MLASVGHHAPAEPAFLDRLGHVLDERRAELVVVQVNGGEDTLAELHDHLADLGLPGTVYDTPTFEVVEDDWRALDVERSLAVCARGCLVVFDELRPGDRGYSHSLGLAARYVRNGATVVATVHASSVACAERRLRRLHLQAREQQGLLALPDDALPPHRLVTFP